MVMRISRHNIQLKRAYEKPTPEDGTRILVDRLWPRGLSKNKAGIDLWLKDVAPSTQLRKWFAHDAARWEEFRQRYIAELQDHTDALDEIRRLSRTNRIMLVYAAHDVLHNEAVVLRDFLTRR